ncbi:hypothetical protein HanHA300_Chr16g0613491 [Helianthus annuus]|nr:hypothetical protein HanHA300_Chr16g0613491 [Helianthus annuus]KAJ0460717.1 hypothetical protein HanHA89_Chr16g0664081 [Helianthus annuus]KAJ0641130.1 hypothetical protein HanLR1_Chr16g0623751 [Helianthus annuus]
MVASCLYDFSLYNLSLFHLTIFSPPPQEKKTKIFINVKTLSHLLFVNLHHDHLTNSPTMDALISHQHRYVFHSNFYFTCN